MLEQVDENTVIFTGSPGEPGLHARSAAFLVRWTAGLDARIEVRRLDPKKKLLLTFACSPASTGNFLLLSSLGVPEGERLKFTARGPDAKAAAFGIRQALREEPPITLPPAELTDADKEKLRAWAARILEGAPEGDEEFVEELEEWMALMVRADFAEQLRGELGELADQRLTEAMTADRKMTGRLQWT